MCNVRKSSPVPQIFECKSSERKSPDIICSNEDIISSHERLHNSIDKPLKWMCLSCSYLNWMKTERCIMCRSGKPNELKLVESLRNIENNGEVAKFNNEKKSKVISLNKSHKWTCPKCTYENWPRTIKCVICHHQKNKNFNDSTRSNDKNLNNERNVRKKKTSSPRRSPPRSPNTLSRQSSANIFELPKNDESCIIELSSAMEKLSTTSDNVRFNQIRNRLTTKDWIWLAACKGVADHDITAVTNYLTKGGDRTRQLTKDDVLILKEPSGFEVGHTLVHLAIRYQHEDILRLLLIPETPHRASKKLPSHVCPELSTTIRKIMAHSIRTRKGEFPCPFFTELVTFSLPADILELEPSCQHQLFSEILDVDVQKVLEEESLINWSNELMNQYGSRIYPLWNRAAGDCLLDSVLQATWGVFDRDNALRKKLYEALSEGHHKFFPRWQEAEEIQASEMNYTLEDYQWKDDWSNIVGLAATAGNSLEQMHVFALAHILRRPIIIYAVKFVKSLRGETIDLARFEGVYLPLLWDAQFCWKNPIVLGYTRGHFSALIPMERPNYANYAGAGAHVEWNEDDAHQTYLPLVDHQGHLLPVHFLTVDELGQEEQLLQQRLDCCITDGGILTAKQIITPRPALVNQMIDEWINRYRKLQVEINETKGASKK